jgi:type I site-specific restriction endonuclease
MSSENLFGGEVIYTYSRKQAIADGVLVDLSRIDAIQQQWKAPMACTATVWSIIEQALETEGQDLNGIAHDLSHMAKLAIREGQAVEEVFFTVIIVGTKRSLKLHIGPGDRAEPVLTLMLPEED